MKLNVSTHDLKRVFFAEHQTTVSAGKMFRRYKKVLLDKGYQNKALTKLPLDWFLKELQKQEFYSDREIELIRSELLKGESK